jgi:hypothetical protein
VKVDDLRIYNVAKYFMSQFNGRMIGHDSDSARLAFPPFLLLSTALFVNNSVLAE